MDKYFTDLIFTIIECLLFLWYTSKLLTFKNENSKLSVFIIFTIYVLTIHYSSRDEILSVLKFPLVVILGTLIVRVIYNEKTSRKILVSLSFFILLVVSELFTVLLISFFSTDDVSALLQESELFALVLFIISKLTLVSVSIYIINRFDRKSIFNLSTQNNYVVIVNLISIIIMVMIGEVAIRTNFFNENPFIILVSIFGLVLINILLFVIVKQMSILHEEDKVNQTYKIKSQLLINHYESEFAKTEEIRKIVHDYNNHLDVLFELNDKNHDKVGSYIKELRNNRVSFTKLVSTNSLVLDIVLNKKMSEMRSKNIQFVFDVDEDIRIPMSDTEFVSLVSNLIDNAIEASLIENEENRFIRLTINSDEGIFILNISNKCRENPLVNGRLRTTRKKNKEQHGYGIKIIEKIVDGNSGSIDYLFANETFIINILI